MRFLYDHRKRGIYMRRIVHHWNIGTYLYSRVFFFLSFLLSFRPLLPLFLFFFSFFFSFSSGGIETRDIWESLKRGIFGKEFEKRVEILERVEIWDVIDLA